MAMARRSSDSIDCTNTASRRGSGGAARRTPRTGDSDLTADCSVAALIRARPADSAAGRLGQAGDSRRVELPSGRRQDHARHRALGRQRRRLDGRTQPPSGRRVASHPGPGDAFDQHLGGAVRQAGALEHAGDDADPVQVARGGVLRSRRFAGRRAGRTCPCRARRPIRQRREPPARPDGRRAAASRRTGRPRRRAAGAPGGGPAVANCSASRAKGRTGQGSDEAAPSHPPQSNGPIC